MSEPAGIEAPLCAAYEEAAEYVSSILIPPGIDLRIAYLIHDAVITPEEDQ